MADCILLSSPVNFQKTLLERCTVKIDSLVRNLPHDTPLSQPQESHPQKTMDYPQHIVW